MLGKLRLLLIAQILIMEMGCTRTPIEKPQEQKPINERIQTVEMKTLTEQATIPGLAIPSKHVTITAKSTSQVMKVHIHAGEYVTENSLLLDMDPSSAYAALARANADVVAARTMAANAHRDYLRYKTLFDEGAVTRKEFENATRQNKITKEASLASESNLQAARTELSYIHIKAPITGYIVNKNVQSGDFVQAGTPLLSIDGIEVEIRAMPGSNLFNHLSKTTPVIININGTSFPGKIVEAVKSADPETHTHPVKISIPQNTGIHPGVYVSVTFLTGMKKAILIPTQDIVRRMGLDGVFILNQDGKAYFHMVKVGLTQANETEITAGLTPGDILIESPNSLLENGQPVHAILSH
ncbi:MAG TPA: efflux RND transporter periplasmic adaptor subunit [Burkholderiales bacterium]|nr:efflux RND transporter periplasmic adaptor subunit [Burkholderiales bacterium]